MSPPCPGGFCEIGVIDKEIDFSRGQYCGVSRYNPAEELCCEGSITTGSKCCGHRGYDPKERICCDGLLVERIGISTVVYGEQLDLQCCGNPVM